MTTIEIPVPELRIEESTDYLPWSEVTQDSTQDVEFRLVFGNYVITSKVYPVAYYDTDDYEKDRCREGFRRYVAERLSALFGEPS